jgi:hypothetical protein
MLIPTTGALEIPPDAGAEIEKVLLRELRRIKFRIYLDFSFLYVAKFRLKCRDGTLHVLSYLCGFIC